ncbi:hypothetical protein [Sulfurospirillum halorespirans]|uniref:hypothetical protein n=1 Tax=Sulfurospirillum halorespirans TaxID=194424 RepID=UPI00084A21D2|nr:hypothetical protein [Sulfurospirillum halorespirans]
MRKVLLALIMVVSCVFASEGQKAVTTCRFDAKQIGAFADSPMTCSGDFKKSSTTQELYADGWRLINSYTHSGNVYLVFEKNKSL